MPNTMPIAMPNTMPITMGTKSNNYKFFKTYPILCPWNLQLVGTKSNNY
jgi:hypothetical protein